MRLQDFEAMVRRLSREVPAHFFEGIAEVTVSPRTVPHPGREGIFTLGECIPIDTGASGEEQQSRIVLYHGSFAALARLEPGYDWQGETWETLTHELRHHLEWRARTPDLEAFDAAAEQNFARHDGEPFDPTVHEALMHTQAELDEGVEVTTVTQVMQPGYKAGERLLRAARVAVAERE